MPNTMSAFSTMHKPTQIASTWVAKSASTAVFQIESPTYRSQSNTKSKKDVIFQPKGPPSSPPNFHRRMQMKVRAMQAASENTPTLKDRCPAFTTNTPFGYLRRNSPYKAFHSSVGPTMVQYTAAKVHGRPIPKKTLTELLPVTLMIEASAVSSWTAAVIEANKSGIDVPSATKVIAVMESSMPQTQPNSSAKSMMKAVRMAMCTNANMKHNQPPQ
mmetsp:Transcript_113460/g.327654  ORF Transcript_113460/g.327654 Transcript_113460/m.327654 type:complete len:216 (+) Transcript_113460:445-1092(+)